MGLFVTMLRSQKAVFNQEISLYRAKKAVERIDREIRLAQTAIPLRVEDSAGNAAQYGNRVEFTRSGEATARAIELTGGADGDLKTAWDNKLIYYPNAASTGSPEEIARGISAPSTSGTFTYMAGANSPLFVHLRTGDSVTSGTDKVKQDAYSGRGMQGVDITITVAPRSDN